MKIDSCKNDLLNIYSIIKGTAPHINLSRLSRSLYRRINFSKKKNQVSLMEITTAIGCSTRCSYCPQDVLLKEYKNKSITHEVLMSFDMFKVYIKTIPASLTLSFAGMCEPWQNESCTDMILYAHKKGHPIMVFTTLKGMNISDYNKIKHIPFKVYKIHLPDDKGNMRIDVNNEYLDLLSYIIKNKPTNLDFTCHISRPDKSVRKLVDWSGPVIHNRAGNNKIKNLKEKKRAGKIECELSNRRFDRNVLLPDGSVVLCGMDYGMKHVLGNLGNISYEDLYQSVKYLELQRALNDANIDIICRSCLHAKTVN